MIGMMIAVVVERTMTVAVEVVVLVVVVRVVGMVAET
jgi:hypothetical protein